MHDRLVDGQVVRMLTGIDFYTRECLTLVTDRRFQGKDAASVLDDLIERHVRPQIIQCDQGTKYT